jgi:hypothetical protein
MGERKMRKLLALALSLATMGFVASSAEAKSTETSINAATTVSTNALPPQIRIQLGGRRRGWRNDGWRNAHRFRTVTSTRLVRYGWQTYRETYETTYMPNGNVRTRLISRIRVR